MLWGYEEMQSLVEKFHSQGFVVNKWKFANCKADADDGDVYLWKGGAGTKNKGLFASGKVVSQCYKDKDISSKGKGEVYVTYRDIRFDFLPKSAWEIAIPSDEIEEYFGQKIGEILTLRASGQQFNGDPDKLRTLWQEIVLNRSLRPDHYLPSEISEQDKAGYTEGSLEQIMVTRYERDPAARARCIEIHGAKCKICGFDYFRVYGKLGLGYIQVHHIVPVSRMGPGYKVNPEKDMIPLCANCHQMIHRTNSMLTPEDLEHRIRPEYFNLINQL